MEAWAAWPERSAASLLERARSGAIEHDRFDSALDPPLGSLEAAVAEDVDHPAVVPEHLRLECRDAVGARDLGEPLEKARSDSLALQRVFHGECDLGAVGLTGKPEVMRDRHDAPCRLADECEHSS